MNINISINKKSTDKLAFGARMSVDFVKYNDIHNKFGVDFFTYVISIIKTLVIRTEILQTGNTVLTERRFMLIKTVPTPLHRLCFMNRYTV